MRDKDETVRKQELVADYLQLLHRIEKCQKEREDTLNRTFWEYKNLNIGELEDTETRFSRLFPERRAYPSAFMASSLGFNKSSMQLKYNEVLTRFHLDRKPRAATLTSALHYERLKILITKYYELLKK